MTVDAQALRDLLERAAALEVDVEVKAAAGLLEEPAAAAVMAEVAELRAEVEALEAADEAAGAVELEGWEFDGETGEADEGVALGEEWGGADFDDFDDEVGVGEKAVGWMKCSKCGSRDADEYADGTARCADCGTVLARVEKKDLDDDEGVELVDEDGVEVKSAAVAEWEDLLARRMALDL